MKKVTICRECKFAEWDSPTGDPGTLKMSGDCLSPDTPIDDFMLGTSSCRGNNGGDCRFFKPLIANGYAGNSNKGE